MDIDDGADKHPEHHDEETRTINSAADPTTVDTLAYPVSPDYVKSWTVTCICQAKLLVRQLSIFQPCKARIRGVRLANDVRTTRSENRPGVGVRVPAQSQVRQTYTDQGTGCADLG